MDGRNLRANTVCGILHEQGGQKRKRAYKYVPEYAQSLVSGTLVVMDAMQQPSRHKRLAAANNERRKVMLL